MQGLSQIVRQNRDAVKRFKNSENEQLVGIAEKSKEALKVIASKN